MLSWQSETRRAAAQAVAAGPVHFLQAKDVGYSTEDLEHVPGESVMGLGCGNHAAIAALKAGQVVVDLRSGAGVDVFPAASKVGPTGRVIGVDMRKEMVDKAESIARDHGHHNVEFRLGEIERLPVQDESVDAITSSCVINLSPDKSKVLREAYRALKLGGRLTVSDIVSQGALPDEIKSNPDAWACCIGGALEQQECLQETKKAGFKHLQVLSGNEFAAKGEANQRPAKLLSITVWAFK